MDKDFEEKIELFAIYTVPSRNVDYFGSTYSSTSLYSGKQIIKGNKYYAYYFDFETFDIIDIFTDDDLLLNNGIYHKLNFATLAKWREMQIDSIMED